MRVRDSFTSMAVARHYDDIRMKSSYTSRKMSAGQQIVESKDDTANFSISQRLRQQNEGGYRAEKNAQDAISLLQNADAGVQSIVDVLQKMRKLAIAAANDSYSDTDKQTIDREFQEYLAEVDRQSEATNYNGRQLIDGTGTASLEFQIGANRNDTVSISLPTVTAASLGIAGASVATNADAENAIQAFDNAILRLGVARSDLGSFISRIENAQGYTSTQRGTNAQAESTMKDLDFLEGAAQMAKESVLLNTAAIALSRANTGNSAAAALMDQVL